MDVKYDEKVRFFKAALYSLEDLDGIMYKHELCLGPMSVDDLDEKQYRRMIAYLRGLRVLTVVMKLLTKHSVMTCRLSLPFPTTLLVCLSHL